MGDFISMSRWRRQIHCPTTTTTATTTTMRTCVARLEHLIFHVISECIPRTMRHHCIHTNTPIYAWANHSLVLFSIFGFWIFFFLLPINHFHFANISFFFLFIALDESNLNRIIDTLSSPQMPLSIALIHRSNNNTNNNN